MPTGDRFFIGSLSEGQKVLSIDSPDEYHHLANVLRLRPGDRVEVTNGRGLLVTGTVTALGKRQAEVSILESRFSRLASPRIVLACAMPKRAKFEDIIDKCTQLGADDIIPLITERTEVVIRGKGIAAKLQRFQKVAVVATKQCKRLWMPTIHPPCRLPEVLQQITPDTVALIPWLEGERTPLRDILGRCQSAKTLMCLIGPEGDFSSSEVALARAKGAVAISLGDNVLRVDTAAEMTVGCLRAMLSSDLRTSGNEAR